MAFSLPRVAATLLAATALAVPARADGIDVVAVGETSPAARAFPAPSAGKPVYCLGTIGNVTDGGFDLSHQARPDPTKVAHEIALALAAQGYVGTPNDRVPSIVITYSWGFTTPRFLRRTPVNGPAVLDILGGSMIEGADMNDPAKAQLIAMAERSRWYLVISAYDYAAWKKDKNIRRLWSVHVSTQRLRQRFSHALPALITAALPLLDKQTDNPKFSVIPDAFASGGAPVAPKKSS